MEIAGLMVDIATFFLVLRLLWPIYRPEQPADARETPARVTPPGGPEYLLMAGDNVVYQGHEILVVRDKRKMLLLNRVQNVSLYKDGTLLFAGNGTDAE